MRTTWLQYGDERFRLHGGSWNKFLWLGLLLLWVAPLLMAQTGREKEAGQLPDAPVPQSATQTRWSPERSPEMWAPCTVGACRVPNEFAGVCCSRRQDRFGVYILAQAYHLYTPRQLAQMAVKDVADSFNLLSVLGSAAIEVGSDSHTVYGPGMPGLARAAGVGLTENMTDEFFGTFVIPSLDHQEPGFRRMPNRPFLRRLAHCATQVFWTRSQTGQPMFNYSNAVGVIAEQAVAVTYVPLRHTGWGPAAERVGLDYATAPIGNLIDEFVPQVASHVNVKAVFFQNIINRVARTVGQPPSM